MQQFDNPTLERVGYSQNSLRETTHRQPLYSRAPRRAFDIAGLQFVA